MWPPFITESTSERSRSNPAPGSYLAFFGRIHPDKGVVAAIEVAKEAGIPLRIAGIIHDEEYFEGEVVPRLDGERVQFVGPVQAEDRSSFLGGAMALLHLIDFDEPFGLSVVEAMACGTPVIAFDRGSMSEIIVEGATGSLVTDVESAVKAVRGIGRFDRSTVRALAVQRFSSDRMVDEYVSAYQRAQSLNLTGDRRVIPSAQAQRRLERLRSDRAGGSYSRMSATGCREPAQVPVPAPAVAPGSA